MINKRPNKLAQGMTATLERQRRCGTFRGHKAMTTPALAVKGTLDPLATTMRPIAKGKCQCCNGTGRVGFVLTEVGKRRLAKLRKSRAL